MSLYAVHINGSDPFKVSDKKVAEALNEAELAYNKLEAFAVANGIMFAVGNVESLAAAVLQCVEVPPDRAPTVGAVRLDLEAVAKPQPDTGSLVVDFSNKEIHELADRLCLHSDLNPDVMQYGRHVTNHDHYVNAIRAHLVLEAGLQWLVEQGLKS